MAENTEVKKAPITMDMLIGDILVEYPDSYLYLMNCGMGCITCPASQMETLQEACYVHGIEPEEVVRYLNIELELEDYDYED